MPDLQDLKKPSLSWLSILWWLDPVPVVMVIYWQRPHSSLDPKLASVGGTGGTQRTKLSSQPGSLGAGKQHSIISHWPAENTWLLLPINLLGLASDRKLSPGSRPHLLMPT